MQNEGDADFAQNDWMDASAQGYDFMMLACFTGDGIDFDFDEA